MGQKTTDEVIDVVEVDGVYVEVAPDAVAERGTAEHETHYQWQLRSLRMQAEQAAFEAEMAACRRRDQLRIEHLNAYAQLSIWATQVSTSRAVCEALRRDLETRQPRAPWWRRLWRWLTEE